MEAEKYSDIEMKICAKFLFLICILLLSQSAPVRAQTPTAVASDDQLKVLLGNKTLLDSNRDGFMRVHRIVYAPGAKHFVVIGCGYECSDNIGFLFRADGTGKRKFTARWDVILDDKLEWSNDGRKFYYYRINSTGADPPKNAPPETWVVVDVATGRKTMATARRLDQGSSYAVFNAADGLAVRVRPGVTAKEAGRLPSDAKGVSITGPGKLSGRAVWVPINHNGVTGWVNQNFLFKEVAGDSDPLGEMAGSEWVLQTWKSGEPALPSPAVTLRFDDGKFTGSSGCNRYSSTVTVARELGTLKVGPTITTRMACPGPAMESESRFIKQLEAVRSFKVSSGQLTLIYELDGTVQSMLFKKK